MGQIPDCKVDSEHMVTKGYLVGSTKEGNHEKGYCSFTVSFEIASAIMFSLWLSHSVAKSVSCCGPRDLTTCTSLITTPQQPGIGCCSHYYILLRPYKSVMSFICLQYDCRQCSCVQSRIYYSTNK